MFTPTWVRCPLRNVDTTASNRLKQAARTWVVHLMAFRFEFGPINNNHVCRFHPDSPAARSQVHPDVIWNALEVEKQNTDWASVELPLPCKVQLRITYFQASCIGEDHKFTVFRGMKIPVHIRICFCSRIWVMTSEASCVSPKILCSRPARCSSRHGSRNPAATMEWHQAAMWWSDAI